MEGHAAIGTRIIKLVDGTPRLGQVAGWDPNESRKKVQILPLSLPTAESTAKPRTVTRTVTQPVYTSYPKRLEGGGQVWLVVYCNGQTDQFTQAELEESVRLAWRARLI